jgi:hypothetical protein
VEIERMLRNPGPLTGRAHRGDDDLVTAELLEHAECFDEWHFTV